MLLRDELRLRPGVPEGADANLRVYSIAASLTPLAPCERPDQNAICGRGVLIDGEGPADANQSLLVVIDPCLRHITSILRAGERPFRCQLNLDQMIALAGTPFRPLIIRTAADVIAGFNGGFLNSPARPHPESLAYYACVRPVLEHSSVPVSFLLNETDSLEQIKEGLRLEFNAVMPESEGLSLDTYRGFVKDVVGLVSRHGVSVEAQVGCLASGAFDHNGRSELTDPDTAGEFVEETGVDALAVSVGNVHILTEGKADLDLDVLRRIRERVKVPLVLHGGTSIPLELNKELIALGVVKFNYGTVLKQAYCKLLN